MRCFPTMAGGDSVVVVEVGPPRARLRVRGEIDIATCPHLDETVASVCAAGVDLLEIDLSEVTFMGSSGLASLLRAQRLAVENGGGVRLLEPSQVVRDLLEMTRLLDRFEVEPG
jgi:anti-sigma B factor antagonist